MTPDTWTIHNLKLQDRAAVLAWVEDPTTRLTSKWASALVALDDRQLVWALMDRISDSQGSTWNLIKPAVEAGATQSLNVLLHSYHTWPETTLSRALEQAAREEAWDAFRLLWPRVKAPFDSLKSNAVKTVLIRGAPTQIWTFLCQQKPPVAWATACLQTMVSQSTLREHVVDIVERLAPLAKTQAQASWALQRALISQHDGLVRALWFHSEPMTAAAALAKEDRFDAIDRMTPWLTADQQLKLCQDHYHRLPQMYALLCKRTEANDRARQAQAEAPHLPTHRGRPRA